MYKIPYATAREDNDTVNQASSARRIGGKVDIAMTDVRSWMSHGRHGSCRITVRGSRRAIAADRRNWMFRCPHRTSMLLLFVVTTLTAGQPSERTSRRTDAWAGSHWSDRRRRFLSNVVQQVTRLPSASPRTHDERSGKSSTRKLPYTAGRSDFTVWSPRFVVSPRWRHSTRSSGLYERIDAWAAR